MAGAVEPARQMKRESTTFGLTTGAKANARVCAEAGPVAWRTNGAPTIGTASSTRCRPLTCRRTVTGDVSLCSATVIHQNRPRRRPRRLRPPLLLRHLRHPRHHRPRRHRHLRLHHRHHHLLLQRRRLCHSTLTRSAMYPSPKKSANRPPRLRARPSAPRGRARTGHLDAGGPARPRADFGTT